MAVQLSGQVPGEQLNGLAEIESELLADETMRVTAVVTLEVTKIVHNVQKQDTYPVVRALQIEPLRDEDASLAVKLQERALQRRTGNVPLPIDDEPVPDVELDLDTPLADKDAAGFEPEPELPTIGKGGRTR